MMKAPIIFRNLFIFTLLFQTISCTYYQKPEMTGVLLSEQTEAVSSQSKYLVIDLSEGEKAKNFPVFELSEIPSTGWTEEYKGDKLVLRYIPAGTFMMGSAQNESGHNENETLHSVTLTQPFYIGIFEITQKQWNLIKGNTKFVVSKDFNPITMVSYADIRGSEEQGVSWPKNNAVARDSFIGKLRVKTGLSFDLPTEAQWEYACRAGTTTSGNTGTNIKPLKKDPNLAAAERHYHDIAINKGGYKTAHAIVGSYKPNAWGLYDMHGNVAEYCLDWYGPYPDTAASIDPKGSNEPIPASPYNNSRVLRGGTYFDYAPSCRSAERTAVYAESSRSNHIRKDQDRGCREILGFRIVVPIADNNLTHAQNLPLEEIPSQHASSY